MKTHFFSNNNYSIALLIISGTLLLPLIYCIKKSGQPVASHYDQMTSFQFRQDQNLPPNLVYFIGDSHTQGLATQAITVNSVNYGIGSDTTKGVLKRIKKLQSLKTAQAIIIAIGYNDLKSISNSEILNNIKLIIKSLPASIPVLMNTIFPVSNQRFDNKLIERILMLNQEIRKLCRLHSEIYCIDTFNALSNSNNALKEDLHIGDGLHLNHNAYEIWIKTIRLALLQAHIKLRQ